MQNILKTAVDTVRNIQNQVDSIYEGAIKDQSGETSKLDLKSFETNALSSLKRVSDGLGIFESGGEQTTTVKPSKDDTSSKLERYDNIEQENRDQKSVRSEESRRTSYDRRSSTSSQSFRDPLGLTRKESESPKRDRVRGITIRGREKFDERSAAGVPESPANKPAGLILGVTSVPPPPPLTLPTSVVALPEVSPLGLANDLSIEQNLDNTIAGLGDPQLDSENIALRYKELEARLAVSERELKIREEQLRNKCQQLNEAFEMQNAMNCTAKNDEDLLSEGRKLSQRVSMLEESLRKKKGELSSMQQQMENLASENEELKNELSKSSKELKKLSAKAASGHDVDVLRNDVEHYKQKCREIQEAADCRDKKKDAGLDAVRKKYSEVVSMVSSLRIELDSSYDRITALESNRDDVFAEKEEEVIRLRNALAETKEAEENMKLFQRIAELEKTVDKLDKEKTTLDLERERADMDFRASSLSAQNEIKSLKKQTEALRNSLDLEKKEREELSKLRYDELNAKQREINELTASIDLLKLSHAQELEDLELNHRGELQLNERMDSESKDEIEYLKNQLAKTTNEVLEKTQNIRDAPLRSKNSTLISTEKDMFKEMVDELASENERLARKLMEAEETMKRSANSSDQQTDLVQELNKYKHLYERENEKAKIYYDQCLALARQKPYPRPENI